MDEHSFFTSQNWVSPIMGVHSSHATLRLEHPMTSWFLSHPAQSLDLHRVTPKPGHASELDTAYRSLMVFHQVLLRSCGSDLVEDHLGASLGQPGDSCFRADVVDAVPTGENEDRNVSD